MSDHRKPGPSGRNSTRKPQRGAPRSEERMNPPSANDAAPFREKGGRRAEPESEAYTLQIFFDPHDGVFCATFVEFPDIRVSDPSRQETIYAAEDRLHSELAALRQAGKPVPEPVRMTDYPSHLEIELSQTLSRKLEALRQNERVSLEQLVTEILTSAVERRGDAGRSQGGGGKGRNQGGGPNRQQGGGGRGNRRGSNYQQTMDSRENFMEYVRNLEKGGGPGYKKR